MATITLYKDKVNGVGSLLDDIIKSSNNLNVQLGTLKNTLQGVDSSTCNLQDTIDSISSSSKSENDKVEDLKRLNGRLTEFIEMVSHRDSSAKSEIERAKEDFYTKYSYLKPECEKSTWEHICDGLKSACEWCKEHWKEICLVLEVIVAIVCLCIPGLQGVGMMILTGMLIGFLSGAIMGGLAGYAQYGVAGILPGVIDGAENGMLIGGLMGGLGGAGALAGATFGCSAAMTTIFSVSTKITIGMMAFDLTALAYNFQNRFLYDTGINLGLVDPTAGRFISDLNQKAHSNPFYNALQLVAGGAAAFSGGYVRTAACFIAGTVIATVDGFVQIENIKSGDVVLSTDVDAMRTRYMRVLDTYIREVDKLVHLTINNETLITTVDHPFYVNGHGFVRAEALCIGSQLMDVHGNICCVEHIFHEKLRDEKRTVYNFQVDDYHTYHVGYQKILVHNAGAEYQLPEAFDYLSEEAKQKQIDALKRMSDSDRETYMQVVEKEPQITAKVQEITSKAGGELEGLDYRLKTPTSTYEKMYGRATSKPITEMNDLIRYTEIFEPDQLAEGTNLSLQEFEANGYSVARVKNTWGDTSNPYNGINATILSPEGQAFEVQFHTLESFNLKNGQLHSLYEQCRVLSPSDPMVAQLNDEMFALSESLQKPLNINEVLNK